MKRIMSVNGSSVYEYATTGPARTLICSTPSSRALLTDPTLCGTPYRRHSRNAVAQALHALTATDTSDLSTTPADQFATLNVLRGGLSFGIEDALGNVLQADPAVSFVGTERPPDGPIELTYDRWELADASVLVVGDIIGTGSTLARVLTEAVERAAKRGRPLQSILVFTIGSRLGVQRVLAALAATPAIASTYVQSQPSLTVVALEALYDLPSPEAPPSFPHFPFDLLRAPAAAAPEYEHHRLSTPGSLFERCAIYDGGVRAFTPADHTAERSAWWASVTDRKLPLAEVATRTAGLETYRKPLEQWKTTVPWSTQISHDEAAAIHRLGQKAIAFADDLTTDEYARDHLVAKGHTGTRT
ncbi:MULTISPECIES: hypothetical protein [Streptomyces]|uniref:hypothetical protein n=1 Tax=Streptomyces TaxID=1883 RepID=UPI00237E6E6C|nr:hypothetical protein [Streptomyces sp. G7(2002)]WDT59125.1 hypothetical protein NUT86_36700 [Streptomyces sp. G7(2002)]